MKCWEKKIALITSCEDEFGLSVIEQLAKAGMTVIGFTKSATILRETKEKFKYIMMAENFAGSLKLYICDVTNAEQVQNIFKKIIENYGGVDVLVNNAYCNENINICTGKLQDLKRMVNLNVTALIYCTRLAIGSMLERKSRGHIINITDLCVYQIPEDSTKDVYIATKSTVTSVNEILRHEFRYLNANIKITNIACGKLEYYLGGKASQCEKLKIRDIAKLVKIILNTPEHLQVHEVVLDSISD